MFHSFLLKSSNRPGNRFPYGNYHHISFIRAIKSGVLTILIQKICHKDLLHLQKIVSQPFSANRKPHTAIANLNMCMIKIFRGGGEGVVDEEGGSSERCLKWGGGGGGRH